MIPARGPSEPARNLHVGSSEKTETLDHHCKFLGVSFQTKGRDFPLMCQYQQVIVGFLPSFPNSLGLQALTERDVFYCISATAAFHLQLLASPDTDLDRATLTGILDGS